MRRRVLTALALILATHTTALAADPVTGPSASPSPQPSAAPEGGRHRTFVDVTVDKEDRGQALAVFDEGGVFLTRGDLQTLGVPTDDAVCIRISGACYIALGALKPEVTYTFDQTTLTLAIVLSASLLPKKELALGLQAPAIVDDHVRGNVLNYSLNDAPDSSLAGILDDRFGIAKDTVVQGGVGRTTAGLVQRTYTNLVVDDPDAQRRLIVGDTTAIGGDVGGSFEFGGVEIQRQFSLDPYTINYPTPTLQTAIDQPSQALIFVNGTLVKTVDLPPGYYTLSNIPVVAGLSNAQVVIRNAYGQTTYNTGDFGAVTLLKKGLTDYQYGFGFLRENLGLPSQSYGPAVLTARYRIGMSDQATIGGLVQSSGGLENVGSDYDVQIGAGVLHAAASESIGSDRNGLNGALAYTTTSLRQSFGVAVMAQGKQYTPVSSFAPEFQTLSTALVYWSHQITRLASINISEQLTKYFDEGTVQQTLVGLTQQLGPWTLSASATLQTSPTVAGAPGGTTRSLAVTFVRTIGSQSNVTTTEAVNVQTGPNAASGYELTSSALSPLDSSYDVGIQTKPGGGVQFGGSANLATPYAALQLYASPGTKWSSINATLQGAIVSTPKGTYFTQAVNDAYALVETGVPGADVYLSGTYVGKTSPNGAMVVPFLQSNYANNINVSNQGLPLTQILEGAANANVGPGYHNGAIFKNHVERVHAVSGKLLFAQGANEIVPMYGDAKLSIAKLEYESPIDEDGRVYFQGVPPGTYELTIAVPGKTCATSVQVPAFDSPTYNFGTIRCTI